MRKMYRHFARISAEYRNLRFTDEEPINRIAESLAWAETIKAADVGCGAGRYDFLLFERLSPRLELFGIDTETNMLREARRYLQKHQFRCFYTMQAYARALPLRSGYLDAVVTFNAVHHFQVREFLYEATRVLKPGGTLFIYTRTRSQNRRSIWGQHFPSFWNKEKRLLETRQFKEIIEEVPALTLDTVNKFQYQRTATLAQLLDKAKRRHYSTFALYSPSDLTKALLRFEENVRRHYRNMTRIVWHDENVMFIARKTEAIAQSAGA
ncbi:MAG: class I SAM-dependent methyltransferase [Candidatus Zhuqueibacterota bacterium]